jgi:hypothetical protein
MAAMVWRTARGQVRVTVGQRARVFGWLRAAGDVRGWILDVNRARRAAGEAPLVAYRDLCRALAAHGPFGELSTVGARSVLKDSAAWFEAA